MIVLMVINLYVSRIILSALGIEEFGIYNVVAGFVSMFYMLSASITVSISRFITFELGAKRNISNVFSAAVNIQLLSTLFVLILAESVGLWFLNNNMTFPADRMSDINVVYQLSIATFIINLINIPFDALIIAYERMKAYAYIGIFDGILKLAVALIIAHSMYDRLILYSALLVLSTIVIKLVGFGYCKLSFRGCTYTFFANFSLIKDMFKYAGWTYIGTSSAILRDQGGNILINMFYGPVANAARGISQQVQSAVNRFMTSFTTALNPQIIKSYAENDYNRTKFLIRIGSTISYYLLIIIVLPILFNTPYILHLWLIDVPNDTVIFVRLSILFILSESISNALVIAASSAQNVKKYQLVVGGIQIMNFPLSYLCLWFKCPAYSIVIVAILLSQVCLFARLLILQNMIKLSIRDYIKYCYMRILLVSCCVTLIPLLLECYNCDNIFSLVINCIICTLTSGIMICLVGLSKNERLLILKIMTSIKDRIYNKLWY